MPGIMPRICRKLAEKAQEGRKYNNLRKAMRIIFQEVEAGRTSVVIEPNDVQLDAEGLEEDQANLFGYVATSLQALGFKVTVIGTGRYNERSLEVSWVV